MSTVHFIRKTAPSASALTGALERSGYTGPPINWGSFEPGALNSPEAVSLACNKRRALYAMRDAGVPVPTLYNAREAAFLARSGTIVLVGRKDYHRKGRGFFLSHSKRDVLRAVRRGATHFMTFIQNAREFRVHIVAGKSIKLSEKIGGEGPCKNYGKGTRFYYPHDFEPKEEVREAARSAVRALGLDFGAVDVLWKDGSCCVLEVNTAPCLTDATSDTLARYARAFMERE